MNSRIARIAVELPRILTGIVSICHGVNKTKTKVLVIDGPGTTIRSNELKDLDFIDKICLPRPSSWH